jgi:tetrahydromethanopterin S-methyltransferase subunit C
MSNNRCPFANALGVPGTGVHSIRFMGFAIIDVVATILAALLTAYVFDINVWYSLIGWFVAGEVLHWIFGTRTAFLVKTGLAREC